MTCYKLDGHKVIHFESLDDMTEKDLNTQTILYSKINICGINAEVSTIFNPLGYSLDIEKPLVFETLIFTDNKQVKDNLKLFNGRRSSILLAIHSHYDAISFASGILLGNSFKTNEESKNG